MLEGPQVPRRPTREEIAAAYGRSVPDVLGPGLAVFFVGINPGLYSGAVGHHFARPGNRFWVVLHASGFTPRVLDPSEERDLLALGLGITNLVRRATARADELEPEELRLGGRRLVAKVRQARPQLVAFLGLGAYRSAFGRRYAVLGELPERVGGARAWLLPNPSGLNAHYQLPELAHAFRSLRRAAGLPDRREGA